MTDQQQPPDWGDELHSEFSVMFEEAVRDIEPSESLQSKLAALGAPDGSLGRGSSHRFVLAGAAVFLLLGAWTVLAQAGRGVTDSISTGASTGVEGSQLRERSEYLLPDPQQWVAVAPVETSGSAESDPGADVWVFTLDDGRLLILLSSVTTGDPRPSLTDAEVVEEPHRSVLSWADGDRELLLVGLSTSRSTLRNAADDLAKTPQGWQLPGAELTASESDRANRPQGAGTQTDYFRIDEEGAVDGDSAIVHIESPGSVGDLYRTLASASSLGEVSTVVLDGEPVYVIADGMEPYALGLRDGYFSVWQAPSAGSEVDIAGFVSSLAVVDAATWESAMSQHQGETATTSTTEAGPAAAANDEPNGRTGRAVNVVRTQIVAENGATTRVVVDFDRPLPGGDVTYIRDLDVVDSPIRAFYSTQRSEEVLVCDATHSFGSAAIGTVDVVLPAAWFADGVEAHTSPPERFGEPPKFIACGPHRGFYQYSIWGPASVGPLDVDVSIGPDRLQLTVDIRPATAGTANSDSQASAEERSRICPGLIRTVDANRLLVEELDRAIDDAMSQLATADDPEDAQARLEELEFRRASRAALALEARRGAQALDC